MERPVLFHDSTPETRAAWHTSTETWREANLDAGKAYALTLDEKAYATNHAATKGILCLWFGLLRHGHPDHTARVLAMQEKMAEAGLRVRQTSEGGKVTGLLLLDLP